ncbi:NACHT, LRR and PYD domains-containing protein 1b allele 3-like [Melanotaenia boesemani]|uniref:NACHT, LRR and PYD domains-containing protein 1b allele 3-like n=1 Tax=Melanotaenia boesemani TaxID=1250792 RepID=UPI001C059211|nr:NACHT, LRR and PYD domains-containing protein 1b allele 3-like [Melanotaenia boesemani]
MLQSPNYRLEIVRSDFWQLNAFTRKTCISDFKLEPDLCEDNTKLMKPPSNFNPEVQTEEVSAKVSYRFKCQSSGVFQCTVTGLVFVMEREAELLYTTIQWDEDLLQPAKKTPAGPLFSIKCSEDAVYQLHLPHCEAKEALCFEGLLSVAHITDDDGMNILKPLEITDTHVVVKVPHLSNFGLLWDTVKRFLKINLPVNGQVLLFHRSPILDVLLLPENIPLPEVAAQQRGAENIRTSSECSLNVNQSYSIHCVPEGLTIQPEHQLFRLKFGPNFHPTFEIFPTENLKKVTVMVQDQETTDVWKRDVHLTVPGARKEVLQRNVPAPDSVSDDDGVQPQDRLFLVRTQFIENVSEPVLDRLLDELYQRKVLNYHEMETVKKKVRAEKARDVIDMVRRKGAEASSVLIDSLCEEDSYLSRELKLP